MHPESATPKTVAQENAKKMQWKKQKQYACNFWKFVFHKTGTIFCICFFAFSWSFCNFLNFGALTGGPPKNAKNAQFQNSQLFAFFAFVFNFPRVFLVFSIFEDRRPSQKCKSAQFQNLHFFLHFVLHFILWSHFFCIFWLHFFSPFFKFLIS